MIGGKNPPSDRVAYHLLKSAVPNAHVDAKKWCDLRDDWLRRHQEQTDGEYYKRVVHYD